MVQGKDKERLGITNADRLQFDRESLERLANYLTKYTNRKRRWRQSRGSEKAAAATAERREIHTEAAGTAGDERRGVRFGILAAEVSGLGDQRHNAHTKRCDKGMEHIPEAAQDDPAKKKARFLRNLANLDFKHSRITDKLSITGKEQTNVARTYRYHVPDAYRGNGGRRPETKRTTCSTDPMLDLTHPYFRAAIADFKRFEGIERTSP